MSALPCQPREGLRRRRAPLLSCPPTASFKVPQTESSVTRHDLDLYQESLSAIHRQTECRPSSRGAAILSSSSLSLKHIVPDSRRPAILTSAPTITPQSST